MLLAGAEVLSKDYEKALATLADILEYGETMPQIFAWQGAVLLLVHRNEEALSFLERATKLSNNLDALSAHAEALISLNRIAEAMEIIDKILQHSPQHQWAVSTRCHILLSQGKCDAACQAAPTEVLAHHVFLRLMQQTSQLATVQSVQRVVADMFMASDRPEWKKAFYGGLVELASGFKRLDFGEHGDAIRLWRDAIKVQFAGSTEYKLLVDVFDTLVRMNTGEPHAILDLPLEQRRLLVSEREEEELLAAKRTGISEQKQPA